MPRMYGVNVKVPQLWNFEELYAPHVWGKPLPLEREPYNGAA